MGTVTLFFLSLLVGYYISLTFSHPKKKKHLLPSLRYKNVEILPNLRIHGKNKTYWFHHWVYYSILAFALFVAFDSFSQMLVLKGYAIGGIFQGLRYPDRFQIRYPRLLNS